MPLSKARSLPYVCTNHFGSPLTKQVCGWESNNLLTNSSNIRSDITKSTRHLAHHEKIINDQNPASWSHPGMGDWRRSGSHQAADPLIEANPHAPDRHTRPHRGRPAVYWQRHQELRLATFFLHCRTSTRHCRSTTGILSRIESELVAENSLEASKQQKPNQTKIHKPNKQKHKTPGNSDTAREIRKTK